MSQNDIETSVSIAYDPRALQRAIKDAGALDSAIDELSSSVGVLDKSLKSVDGDIDVKINADLSALDGIGDLKMTPLVDVVVDDGALQTALSLADDLNTSYTPKLTLDDKALRDAQDLLNKLDAQEASVKITTEDSALRSTNLLIADIDSAAPSVTVNADDSELDGTKRKIGDIDSAAPDVKVNTEDSALDEVKGKLDELRNLAVIDLIMNVGEMPAVEDIPILSTIIEADTAARNLQATLGTGFKPQHAEEAQTVYQNNFGADQTEAATAYGKVVQTIGNDMGTAAKSGENLATVTGQIFTVADTSGEDFTAVLAAADKLYASGQVDSYAEGLDLITTGFQNGLNSGEDLLDTVREYSLQFEQLGFTSGEFFNSLKAGMDAGAYNTDFIADLIQEMNIRAQAAMAGSGVEFDALKAMGLLDEAKAYSAGEITGKQYAEAVAAAAKEGLANGSITQQTIFDALGTKAENLTIPVTLEILGTSGGGVFDAAGGATDAAAEALYGGIASSVETAKRLVETELAASIDEAFDIQGKIDAFNDGIKQFSALVASGEDIPTAIEEAFNLDGFAETFARFESAIGNLVIEVSNLIASVLEATGNEGAGESIRTGTAGMAAQQLAFDLKLQDDGTGIQNAVNTAIRRGVTDAALEDALTTAGMELIAEGDLEKAQQFVEAIQTAQTVTLPPALTDYLSGKGIDPTNLKAVREELEKITSDTSNLGPIEFFKSPVEGMGALDFDNLLGTVKLAEQAQTAAAPIAQEFQNALFDEFNTLFEGGSFLEGMNLADSLGMEDMKTLFQTELAGVLNEFPDQLEEQMTLGTTPINNFEIAAKTALENVNTKASDVAPQIGASIDGSIGTPLTDATNATNTLAETILAQVPVIGEQTTQMQTDLAASSEKVDDLNTSVDTLNDANLGPLQGQFAGLRKGIEDQVNYAIEQVNKLAGALAGLGGTSVGVPTITVPGVAGGGSHLYGGVIPSGTIGQMHGNEIFAAAPQGTDISVLNAATSSTIENAVAALVGRGGTGSGVSNVYNNQQFFYNIQSNAQGFAADGAARAARGF